jgi:hypothetical protein
MQQKLSWYEQESLSGALNSFHAAKRQRDVAESTGVILEGGALVPASRFSRHGESSRTTPEKALF